jgi:hypothetical protein
MFVIHGSVSKIKKRINKNSRTRYYTILYITDGTESAVETYVTLNGKLHRSNGPAYVSTKIDGNVMCERWHVHGKHIASSHISSYLYDVTRMENILRPQTRVYHM